MKLLHGAIVLVFVFGASARAMAQHRRDSTQAADTVKDLPLTAAQRQSFVGSYSVTVPLGGENDLLRVFDDNGVLKAQSMHDKETRRLIYQGDAVFRPEGIPDFAITFVLEGGRATKFTARKPEGVMEGVRVQ